MRIPPGKGWPPPGTESCVVRGRPRLRSVDRESKSCVIEPRKHQCGSRRRMLKRRQHRSASLAWRRGPTGVTERGECSRGVPRNLGDPVVSSDEDGRATGEAQARRRGVPRGAGANKRTRAGTHQAKETKRGGTDGGKSELLMYLRSGGTELKGPRGGKRGAGERNRWRET